MYEWDTLWESEDCKGQRQTDRDRLYKEYIQKSIENNTKGRDFLENVLKEAGFEVVKSYASFVYFYPKGITSEDLVNELGSYGVMIRQFGDYSRVSVGLPEQNERFKQTLKQVLNQ